MEMIDVLTKLKEIAESKPELVQDAMANVERTNPKVDEGAVKQAMHDDAENMSKEEFVKKYGKESENFYNSINGTEEAVEGKMPAGLKAYHDKKAGKEDKKEESKSKPDFLDMDKDGDKKEPMKKAIKDKETVKEAIQISTDSPQEASMMMQILKLAGVQPVDAKMIGAEEPTEEPTEEYANEPQEKIQNIDSLVNKHSGGLNRQKAQFAKAQDGDNAMAVGENLADTLKQQYESFKEAYEQEADKAKK